MPFDNAAFDGPTRSPNESSRRISNPSYEHVISDLAAALLRRLDGVGKIGVLVTDNAKVDQWNAALSRCSCNAVIEDREGRYRNASFVGVGIPGVIDRANGSGQLGSQSGIQRRPILQAKLLSYFGES
jgi:hypothetical protein